MIQNNVKNNDNLFLILLLNIKVYDFLLSPTTINSTKTWRILRLFSILFLHFFFYYYCLYCQHQKYKINHGYLNNNLSTFFQLWINIKRPLYYLRVLCLSYQYSLFNIVMSSSKESIWYCQLDKNVLGPVVPLRG